jgi:hypothetical protein
MKNDFIVPIFLLLAVFTVNCSAKYSGDLTQGFEIFKLNDEYLVRGKIDLETHFKSNQADEVIQYALNKAKKSGGEVYLHPGIYLVRKQIDVPGHTTLAGSGNATKLVFADNHETGIAVSCKGVDKSNIKDFFISSDLSNLSAKTGILIDSCGDVTVEDITCLGMQDHGIVLSNNSFLSEIRGCKIAGTGKSGILVEKLDKGGRGGDWVPSLISNCIIYACGKGIETSRSLVINITDCQVYQTKGHGFHIHSKSNSVIISGCRTFQVTGNAVNVDDSHEINISSNIFCWQTEDGIVLNKVMWGTVSANNIIDNGSINLFDPAEDSLIKADYKRPFIKSPAENQEIPLYNGISLLNETKGVTVTANAIFNWPVVPPMQYGIEEDVTCFSNLISGNNINFCKEGILSRGEKTIVETNQVYAEQPYYGKAGEKYQYFDTRLMQEFIEEINVSL